MRFLFFLSFLFSFTTISFSQDYLTDIATKTCDCSKSISNALDREQVEMKIGLCMLEMALPYKKELKKDHNIDLDNIMASPEQGTKLGEMVGMKMGMICPEVFTKMFSEGGTNESVTKSTESFEGLVTNIEEGQFIVFSVKDSNGKTTKFYWLNFINSNIELISNYKSLLNQSIKISFTSQEFFDYKINEYRDFNVITELEKLSK